MKVLCISVVTKYKPEECDGVRPVVREGNIYSVIDESPDDNPDYYELAEHVGYSYLKRLFIPVSSIDETELVRNYNKIISDGSVLFSYIEQLEF